MNFTSSWQAFLLVLDQHALLARLFIASVELATLAVVTTLVLKIARLRTPYLVALLWALVLAKPLVTLALGSPWHIIQVPISTPQNMAQPDHGDLGRTANAPIADASATQWQAIHLHAGDSENSSSQSAQNYPENVPAPLTQNHPQAANDVFASACSIAVWLWLAGVVFMTVRALWIRRRLALILARCQIPDVQVQHLYAEVSAWLKLTKSPPLLVTDELETPALVGLWRPTILVPAWLASKADRAALTWSLKHELTHWKQGDLWFIRLRELACAVMYFHPCAWWASRRMEEALEIACDRAVVSSDAEAADYASRLYQILDAVRQQRGRRLTTGLFATRSQIAKRLVMLLQSPLRLRPKLTATAAIGFAILATLVLTLGIGLRHEAGAQDQAKNSTNQPTTKSQADDSSSNKAPGADKPSDQQAGKSNEAVQSETTKTVSIDGTVSDENKQPVAGVTIRHWSIEVEAEPTTTDADGRFRFFVQSPGDVIVFADDAVAHRQGYGYGLASISGPAKSFTLLPIALKPIQQTTLKVVDAQGAPVAGATYTALHCKFFLGEVLFCGTTDAAGQATLEYTDDALMHEILAFKSGIGFDYFISPLASSGTATTIEVSTDAKLRQPLPAQLMLHLNGARTLKCVASTPSGEGVPDATFRLNFVTLPGKAAELNLESTDCRFLKIKSDVAGIATFDWLPRNFIGQMRLRCSTRGYYEVRDLQAPDPWILYSQAPVEELQATFLRTPKITGHVYLPDDKPAAGIKLELGRDVGVILSRTTTKADGSFALSAQLNLSKDGEYGVTVYDDHWAAPSRMVKVGESATLDNVDIKLAQGTVVRGTLSEAPDNKPVANQSIDLIEITRSADGNTQAKAKTDSGRTNGFIRQTSTDKDGHYHFSVAPGTYVVYVPSRRPFSEEHPSEFTVDGQHEVVVDLAVSQTPPLAHFSGKVVDVGGNPVANARVVGSYLEKMDRITDYLRTKSTADDTFEFERIPMPMLVEAWASLNQPRVAGATLIKPDQKEASIQVFPTVEAHGRLVDEHGQPVAGEKGWLATRIGMPAGIEALGTGERFFSEPDGTYTLTGLIPGLEYGVYYSEKGKAAIATKLATFAPEAGKPTELGDTALPGTQIKPASPKND